MPAKHLFHSLIKCHRSPVRADRLISGGQGITDCRLVELERRQFPVQTSDFCYEPCSRVVRNKSSQFVEAQSAQMLGTVQRVEATSVEIVGVADVVQPRASNQEAALLRWHGLLQRLGPHRDSVAMPPPLRVAAEQPCCVCRGVGRHGEIRSCLISHQYQEHDVFSQVVSPCLPGARGRRRGRAWPSALGGSPTASPAQDPSPCREACEVTARRALPAGQCTVGSHRASQSRPAGVAVSIRWPCP